ncbi:L-threonylcarbamoyladenylate synthase [Marinoscillum sp. MHG1-6]|uniref:L-threonylcarbamoyladenylate synthase n=1 Tax=Marinoscillum sp. MHG1-6 TaxID=2959627 RepID=UPI0021576D7E|nr:L-threonylcarbamoyladenylate synthase [Marinoscillum sp. MHG1-6]
MALIGSDIAQAKAHLDRGELVGIPTETVYGLAGNALNEEAALNIFKTKNRPEFDPLIVHTHAIEELDKYVTEIPEKAITLAHAVWPGPLTILLEKKSIIPDLITSGLSTVAIRIPKHPLTLALLKSLDYPLAAPSANPFGYVSPTTASHVNDQLGEKIPYVLDGGPCSVGVESTIVGFEHDAKPTIYRLGGKKVEDIESLIGEVDVKLNKSSNPVAPGMLLSHYAPGVQVHLGEISDLLKKHHDKRIGIISFSQSFSAPNIAKQIVLSQNADLDEAARKIFSALRSLDSPEIDLIITEKLPETGLGRAINDRLERAAVRY